jgi:parvulin-like peptidyl-prolyl isomerase
MTFRAKPVARRSGRSGWGAGDRRNTLINAGFAGAIVVAVLILVGYGAWTWYDDHFGVAASVDGQVITRDDLRNRLEIEQFRLAYVEGRIRTLMAKGQISATDGAQQLAFLDQRRQVLPSLSLERLVDALLMTRLAADEGISVSEDDVSAQFLVEATTSEQRHVWMIEIEPQVDEVTGQVGEPQRAEARARAEAALADLKAGKPWEEIAQTSSDSTTAAKGGDLGWMGEESGYDEAFMAAVFALDPNTPSDIVEGADDTFRIGRVTEIAPEEVDATLETQIEEAGIGLERYRLAVRDDVVRVKLSEKIVAQLSEPGPQRHVLEIYLPEPNQSQLGEPGVKVRHILFAPNDDPDAASDLPSDDPAWAAAKADAEAAYAELKLHPEDFDAMAREVSDEPSAAETGGKQPWYFESSQIAEPFKDAILEPGLEPGQILEPVISTFGWHVIQFLRPEGEGEKAWAESLKAQLDDGADFAQLVRDNSEGDTADEGGELGWIARGQLEETLELGIFDTPVGEVSNVVVNAGDGFYLFKILAEEVREPTDEQLQIFEDQGFSRWYSDKKAAADIEYAIGPAA